MPTTATAPSTFPCGCAPTSSATPTNPMPTPTRRRPVTRTSRKNPNATTALKIGTEPWMIEARPESILVSPHESSQNGTAMLTRPTRTSQPALSRIAVTVAGPPPEPLRAGGLLAALVGALRVQALGAAAAPPSLRRRARPPGPGRERGRPRPRRRAGGRLQGRVAQPPVRGRAVPGSRNRRRRDPPRHHRDGRAADRAARRALVRQSRLSLLARCARHRPLRQLRWGRERRRC